MLLIIVPSSVVEQEKEIQYVPVILQRARYLVLLSECAQKFPMEEQVKQTTVWLMRLHIFEVAVQIGHMQPTYMNWATLRLAT
jgi:hypothetical protein